jgi:hypothetical protein
MGLKLNESSEIWGSSESGHKMAVVVNPMSRDRFTTLTMEAAVSSQSFVHLYQCTRVPVNTTLPTKRHNSRLQ